MYNFRLKEILWKELFVTDCLKIVNVKLASERFLEHLHNVEKVTALQK